MSGTLAAAAAARVAFMIEKTSLFSGVCDNIFDQLYEQLRASLTAYGIPVKQPNADEVSALEGDWSVADGMTRAEFHEFYAKVFTTAGATTAKSAANEYGLAALGGIAGLMILKRTIRAVPVVGLLSAPILGLLPSLLIGPVLGVALIYTYRSGDLLALKNKLFTAKIKPIQR
ncbi:MAG: hypothetical protein WDW38_000815 [Sanguina aurantia]